jgi:hypothetical protein
MIQELVKGPSYWHSTCHMSRTTCAIGGILLLCIACSSVSRKSATDDDPRLLEAYQIDADIAALVSKGSLTEMEQVTLFNLFNRRFSVLHKWGNGEARGEPTATTRLSVTTVVAAKTSNTVSRVSVFGTERATVETKSKEGLRRTFYLINVEKQWRIIGDIGGPDFF